MAFDRKSILKIVGNYNINNTSGNGITHNIEDDILTIMYDDYFYQATIGGSESIVTDPIELGNTFSIMVEVPNFQSIQITALLRTKIDNNDVVMQNSIPISVPDDFLSKIDTQNFSFTYDGSTSNEGCTQPQYPNYDCSKRYDDGENCHTNEVIGCTNPTACTCDEPRCIGLCGECSDGTTPGGINQYECENQAGGYTWNEYCGDEENQWKCGSIVEGFGFYNPSPKITSSVVCMPFPIKPEISIGAMDIIPDEDGITDLVFDNNDSFLEVKTDNPILITINPNLDGIGEYLNKFDTVSFDVDKAYITSATLGTTQVIPAEYESNIIGEFDVNNSTGWEGEISNTNANHWHIRDGYAEIGVNTTVFSRRLKYKVIDNNCGGDNQLSCIENDVPYRLSFTIYDYDGGKLDLRKISLDGSYDNFNTVITPDDPESLPPLSSDGEEGWHTGRTYEFETFRSSTVNQSLSNSSATYDGYIFFRSDDAFNADNLRYAKFKIKDVKLKKIIPSYIGIVEDATKQVEFQNIGATSRVIASVTDEYELDYFGELFVINLPFEDLITWKITLKNIIFSYQGEIIEHNYDGSYIETNVDYNINPTSDQLLINEYDSFNYKNNRAEKIDKLYNHEYTEKVKLHRGQNNISLWATRSSNYSGDVAPVRFTQLSYYLNIINTDVSGPILQKLANQGGSATLSDFDNLDSWVFDSGVQFTDMDGIPSSGGTLLSQLRPARQVAYTFTICESTTYEDNTPISGCYEDDDNTILKNVFEFEFQGYISNLFARINYDVKCQTTDQYYAWMFDEQEDAGCINANCSDCIYDLNRPRIATVGENDSFDAISTYYNAIFDYEKGFLNIGFYPQVKEFIYEDVNTILSFEEDIPALGTMQGNLLGDALYHGLQGRFIDVIQYETELITHSDMDFDCDYTLLVGTLEEQISFGKCYDTYLGTLTNLSLGNGYAINVNTGYFGQDGDSYNSSIHAYLNLYYDFCGVASGGSTLHEPNSDTDDNAFCIDNRCRGGITHSQTCFTDGTRDDICFGNCCLYPNEIVDWYEAPENETVGKMYLNRLRLCDDAGTYDGNLGVDVYTTYRCSLDDKEYPLDEIGGADICEANCGDNSSGICGNNPINYYREANDCDGYLDCHDNCYDYDAVTGEFAYFDRYGICCKIGNMDAAGICFGNSSIDACGFDFILEGSIGVEVTNFSRDVIDIPNYPIQSISDSVVIKNSGTFDINLNTNGSQVSEIIIPLTPNLTVKGASFGTIGDVTIINNDDYSFDELFDISITTDNNEILITSLFDGVLFISNSIPITIEWEMNLPNSSDEQTNDGIDNYSNFCVNRGSIHIYKLDTPYQINFTYNSEYLDDDGCFISPKIYGCLGVTGYEINDSYYCDIGGIDCIVDYNNDGDVDLCEYIGCDNVIWNTRGVTGDTAVLDDCGICNGNNFCDTFENSVGEMDEVGGTCSAEWSGDDFDCAGECFGTNWESDCGCVAAGNSGDDCDDCFGTPNGSSEIDNCGVCGGDDSTCTGCTDDTACNYNPNAFGDDGSCSYTTIYYFDGDGDGMGCGSQQVSLCPDNPAVLSGIYVLVGDGVEDDLNCLCPNTCGTGGDESCLDTCGICFGGNACQGCMDDDAINYDDGYTHDCVGDDGGTDYSCCIYQSDVVNDWLALDTTGYGAEIGRFVDGAPVDPDGDGAGNPIIIYDYADANYNYVHVMNTESNAIDLYLEDNITDNSSLDPAVTHTHSDGSQYIIFPYADGTYQYVIPSADNASAITDYLGNQVTDNEELDPAQDNNDYIIFQYQTADHQYVIPSADDEDAINLFLYNQVYNEGDNYHQYGVYGDLTGVPSGNYEYAIFSYVAGYEYEPADDDFSVALEAYYAAGDLDTWLVENTEDQEEADSNLTEFLENFGGTQIEYQTIYIRGDAPGGNFEPNIVSYPVEFLSYDFIEVLTASFSGDLQLGDSIMIFYSNESFEWNTIFINYFLGIWTTVPSDWDGFIPNGAGLRFSLQSNATITWTLPESDNGGGSDA
jgi:hypothetical protein